MKKILLCLSLAIPVFKAQAQKFDLSCLSYTTYSKDSALYEFYLMTSGGATFNDLLGLTFSFFNGQNTILAPCNCSSGFCNTYSFVGSGGSTYKIIINGGSGSVLFKKMALDANSIQSVQVSLMTTFPMSSPSCPLTPISTEIKEVFFEEKNTIVNVFSFYGEMIYKGNLIDFYQQNPSGLYVIKGETGQVSKVFLQ